MVETIMLIYNLQVIIALGFKIDTERNGMRLGGAGDAEGS